MKKNDSTFGAVTLLGASQGPLFPVAGRYTIKVKIPVIDGGRYVPVSSVCRTTITEPETKRHTKLAERIWRSPELHRSLIVGGHLSFRGKQLIAAILKSKELRTHFEFNEVKQALSRTERRDKSFAYSASLICNTTEMTRQEAMRLLQVLETSVSGSLTAASIESLQQLLMVLREKTRLGIIPERLCHSFNRNLNTVIRLLSKRD